MPACLPTLTPPNPPFNRPPPPAEGGGGEAQEEPCQKAQGLAQEEGRGQEGVRELLSGARRTASRGAAPAHRPMSRPRALCAECSSPLCV